MKRTLKDYITVLFGSGFARAVAVLNSIIIARLLGPKEFGKFTIFYIVMVLIWQLPQAFDASFVKYARTSNCSSEKRVFLKTAIFLKLLYSGFALCISYPLSYFLANYCFHKPEIQGILVVAVFCGVFLSFLMTIASTFQEKEKFTEFAFVHAFYTISIFCVLLLFKALKFEFSLKNVILIYLVISVTIGVISIKFLLKKAGRLFPLNTNALKTSFSLSKWIFGAICVYCIFQRIDMLFLTRYVNFSSIGIYFVAAQVTMAISVMTGSLAGISLPKASTAIKSRTSLKSFIKESILVVAMINIFVIALIIIAPFCIKILYGDKYLLATSILRILLIGWFFAVTYVPFSFLFYALDDSKTIFLLEVIKFFTVFILLYYLIPLYGIYGAAISVSFSLFINTILSFGVLKRKFKAGKTYGSKYSQKIFL